MRLRRFWADQRGNFVLLFAAAFVVSIGLGAIAVDSAALYTERRALQAGVDLAAITAAGNPAQAQSLAELVLVDERLMTPGETAALTVVTGRYSGDISQPVATRFVPGGTPVNAVQVSFHKPGTLHFARALSAPPELAASALAAFTPEVSFSLGSRLASLNEGLANAILSAFLGTNVSLSVVDYNALASARVDALTFLGALGQRLNVDAGSFVDVLKLRARSGQIAGALADLSAGDAHRLLLLLSQNGLGAEVRVQKLIALGMLKSRELGGDAASGIGLSALDILMASARLADGTRQLGLNLGANVPNLASLRLDLVIGEPAQGAGWVRIGERNAQLRTTQLRMRLASELLGNLILLGARVRVPILLDVAHAEAQVVSISCPSADQAHGAVQFAVKPGVLKLTLGEASNAQLANFGQGLTPTRAQLIDLALLKVSGWAQIEVAQSTPRLVSFSSAEIGAKTTKTVRTSTMVSSLVGSLLGELNLRIDVLGIGLSSPAVIGSTLRALLSPLGPALDLTITGVFSALGLGLGEADLTVYGVRCSAPAIVQ